MREGVPRAPAPSAEEKTAENKEAPRRDTEEEKVVAASADSERHAASDPIEPVEVAPLESRADVASQQNEDDSVPVERSHGRALPR
jgi:hypothetical protein